MAEDEMVVVNLMKSQRPQMAVSFVFVVDGDDVMMM
jgi:hypothetical protein